MSKEEYGQKGIAGSVKYDAGKAPVYRGAIAYFPNAISGVSQVSAFGATKYAWNGFLHVPDGFNRYSDGMVRHIIEEGKGNFLDPESRLPHDWHIAWNALARIELRLKDAAQEPRK